MLLVYVGGVYIGHWLTGRAQVQALWARWEATQRPGSRHEPGRGCLFPQLPVSEDFKAFSGYRAWLHHEAGEVQTVIEGQSQSSSYGGMLQVDALHASLEPLRQKGFGLCRYCTGCG